MCLFGFDGQLSFSWPSLFILKDICLPSNLELTKEIKMQIPLWLNDIVNLFFPNVCVVCGEALNKQEEIVCLSCLIKLPKTGFHLHQDNPVSRVFWGRVNLKAASSFLFFNKGGSVQNLMHALKYNSRQEVGVYLGEQFGRELNESPLFNDIDLIIPVPLHPKKFHKRGFNQSAAIAAGLNKKLNVSVDTENFIRQVNTDSQTKKSRYNRWENVKGVFGIRNKDKLIGKHLLLVDDVLTTGATLEACASILLELEDTKVSVATLAYAQA